MALQKKAASAASNNRCVWSVDMTLSGVLTSEKQTQISVDCAQEIDVADGDTDVSSRNERESVARTRRQMP